MSRLIYLLITLLYAVIFSRCGSSKVIAVDKHDSVRVEIIERLVELRDTLSVEIPKIVERVTVMENQSYLENEFARSQATILPDGALSHTLESIEQTLVKPIATSVEVRDSIIYREVVVRQSVEVPRELTAWQQLQLYGFWVELLILIVVLVAIICLR